MLDISSNNPAMKTSKLPLPALRSEKLLDQLRERIRYLHYSMRTEQAYVHWARAFIHFHDRRHPADMGRPEVELFLSWLTNKRKVSASTHSQALSALLFLYGKVLGVDLPWMSGIDRPRGTKRLPVVLWPDEIARIFAVMEGEHRLFAQLLYGTGLRITEGVQIRWPDAAASRCPTHWSGSIRGRGIHGHGSGSFRRRRTRWIRARAWCAVTTCTTRPSSAASSGPSASLEYPSPRGRICSGIRSPPRCCRPAMTSGRCRNFSDMPMCRRR